MCVQSMVHRARGHVVDGNRSKFSIKEADLMACINRDTTDIEQPQRRWRSRMGGSKMRTRIFALADQ